MGCRVFDDSFTSHCYIVQQWISSNHRGNLSNENRSRASGWFGGSVGGRNLSGKECQRLLLCKISALSESADID